MATTTIRVSLEIRDRIHKLAQQAGLSLQEVIEKALELYRRQQILESANRAYASLRQDPDAWHAYQTEQESWDETLTDGLEEV
ncbi:MAG: toxin-antitoxin system protein [Cyanobacteria bacterium P01_A01_bin.17]